MRDRDLYDVGLVDGPLRPDAFREDPSRLIRWERAMARDVVAPLAAAARTLWRVTRSVYVTGCPSRVEQLIAPVIILGVLAILAQVVLGAHGAALWAASEAGRR
jgi:hypothetical protein